MVTLMGAGETKAGKRASPESFLFVLLWQSAPLLLVLSPFLSVRADEVGIF